MGPGPPLRLGILSETLGGSARRRMLPTPGDDSVGEAERSRVLRRRLNAEGDMVEMRSHACDGNVPTDCNDAPRRKTIEVSKIHLGNVAERECGGGVDAWGSSANSACSDAAAVEAWHGREHAVGAREVIGLSERQP